MVHESSRAIRVSLVTGLLSGLPDTLDTILDYYWFSYCESRFHWIYSTVRILFSESLVLFAITELRGISFSRLNCVYYVMIMFVCLESFSQSIWLLSVFFFLWILGVRPASLGIRHLYFLYWTRHSLFPKNEESRDLWCLDYMFVWFSSINLHWKMFIL